MNIQLSYLHFTITPTIITPMMKNKRMIASPITAIDPLSSLGLGGDQGHIKGELSLSISTLLQSLFSLYTTLLTEIVVVFLSMSPYNLPV